MPIHMRKISKEAKEKPSNSGRRLSEMQPVLPSPPSFFLACLPYCDPFFVYQYPFFSAIFYACFSVIIVSCVKYFLLYGLPLFWVLLFF
ncbi:hypothetical protein FKM82_009765 [Ascaphus truei]